MIITTRNGKTFDTATDLTSPERHILQKLFLWELMASSIEEFRRKTEEAIRRGWNESGPVRESDTLSTIIADLEEKIILRLREERRAEYE
jgi:hypothetical protein